MAYNSLGDLFTAIADAIRAKKGTSSTISAQNFPSQIASIESANYATKSVTLGSSNASISFPDLLGSPKFFVAILNQSSSIYTSSSNPTILAVYKTGTGSTKYALSMYQGSTTTKPATAARTSSYLAYSYDSGTSTLTITSSRTTSTPGSFADATYTLIYTY